MPAVNPGPATTGTANSVATFTPVNSLSNSGPQEQNQLRLLAFAKSVDCSVAGDSQTCKVLNSARYSVQSVLFVKSVSAATQTPATAGMAIYTGAGATGYNIYASAVMTGLAAQTMVYFAAANTTTLTTDQTVYFRVGTTTAAGLVDVMVYGYDVST